MKPYHALIRNEQVSGSIPLNFTIIPVESGTAEAALLQVRKFTWMEQPFACPRGPVKIPKMHLSRTSTQNYFDNHQKKLATGFICGNFTPETQQSSHDSRQRILLPAWH